MRMSRRMGIHNACGKKSKTDIAKELFSNMTLESGAASYNSSQKTGTFSIEITEKPRYIFAFANAWSIYKLVGTERTKINDVYNTASISASSSSGNWSLISPRSYGGAAILVSFPEEYEEDEIDSILSSISAVSSAGRNSSSKAYVGLVTDGFSGADFAIACLASSGPRFNVSVSHKENWLTALFGRSNAASIFDGRMFLRYDSSGGCYSLSQDGAANSSTYGGVIVTFTVE